jgi:Spy/CpxP family protein refolding chaperone
MTLASLSLRRTGSLRRLSLALALALGLASGVAPALAQPVAQPLTQPTTQPGGTPSVQGTRQQRPQRLTPEQRQKIFPEQRSLAVQDHQARIAILEKGQRCLKAAANADALSDCMRQEREAMQSQRTQHMASMRDLLQRNGLPVPQWRPMRGKPGMGMPGTGMPGTGMPGGPGYGGGKGTPQAL